MAPLKHSSPKITINIILSIFLGGLLGVGFAVAAEMLDRRVRSAEDLSQLLGLPVLGELMSSTKQSKSTKLKLRNFFKQMRAKKTFKPYSKVQFFAK